MSQKVTTDALNLKENRLNLYDAECTTNSTGSTIDTGTTGASPAAGMRIRVRFVNNVNRTATTSLTVNGASAVIWKNGSAISPSNPLSIDAGQYRVFEYNGTQWELKLLGLALWTDDGGRVGLLGGADIVIETYRSGTSWYRLYRSGWIEQGGFITKTTSNTEAMTFHKPMKDTNYSIQITVYDTRTNDNAAHGVKITSRTASGLSVQLSSSWSSGSNNINLPYYWEVKGFTA